MSIFKVKVIPEHRPEGIPDGIAMVAPRPLHGVEAKLHDAWGWVGQVIVQHNDYSAIDNNYRMDASVVLWIAPEILIEEERYRLILQYGEEAMSVLSEDELLEGGLRHANENLVIEL